MNEGRMIEKITEHDAHLDTLSHAIEDMAKAATATNTKLDKVVDAITTQNVLIERMNNLDNNIRESFSRVHEKIRLLEVTHREGGGCSDLNVLTGKMKGANEKVKDLCTRLSDAEKIIGTLVGGDTIRWGIGGLVLVMISFGVYVVSHIHSVENAITSQEVNHAYLKESVKYKYDRVVRLIEVASINKKQKD